jgi:hypothetical protein
MWRGWLGLNIFFLAQQNDNALSSLENNSFAVQSTLLTLVGISTHDLQVCEADALSSFVNTYLGRYIHMCIHTYIHSIGAFTELFPIF